MGSRYRSPNGNQEINLFSAFIAGSKYLFILINNPNCLWGSGLKGQDIVVGGKKNGLGGLLARIKSIYEASIRLF